MKGQKTELIKDAMSERIIEAAESIVTAEGVCALNVRRVLMKLGITNRVFYNRFHNIADVLGVIYRNTIIKVRRSTMENGICGEGDFFELVTDMVVASLKVSYETKMQFNQYVFENDSQTNSNYEWWTWEIKKLIEYAKSKGLIKDVDSDTMSYSIWCFCRGFNADAVGRNLPVDEAIEKFRYSFAFLLEGLKK